MLIIEIFRGCGAICRDLHNEGYSLPILLMVAGFTDMICGSMIISPDSEYYVINACIGGATFFVGGMSAICVDHCRRTARRRQRLLSDMPYQAPSEPAPPALVPSAVPTQTASALPPYEPPAYTANTTPQPPKAK